MAKHDKNNIEANIKQSLDESIDTLDANTLSKIRQIRAQAIEKTINTQEARHNNWLINTLLNKRGMFVGGLATACVMVLAVMLLVNSPTSMQTIPDVDIELISSLENLDLFEDLEFYEWLEEDGLPS